MLPPNCLFGLLGLSGSWLHETDHFNKTNQINQITRRWLISASDVPSSNGGLGESLETRGLIFLACFSLPRILRLSEVAHFSPVAFVAVKLYAPVEVKATG